MKKTGGLLLMGLVPLAVGYLLNFVMMALPVPPFFLGAVMLVLWGYYCHKRAADDTSAVLQTLMMNAVGTLMLILVLVQELILGAYWGNYAGLITQVYFLPCLPLISVLAHIFTRVTALWALYLIEWAFMLAASFIGCRAARKR